MELPENAVRARLYLAEADEAGVAAAWAEVASRSAALTAGHLWHMDPLAFRPPRRLSSAEWLLTPGDDKPQPEPAPAPPPPSPPAPPDAAATTTTAAATPPPPPHVLEGTVQFGDNVADEWVVVWVLRELTRGLPGLVAAVHDSDGEPLLIEAALHLPAWANPDTSVNRVFVAGGLVHLIPLPTTPAMLGRYPAGTPALCEAVRLVRDPACATAASAAVQACIADRVVSPEAARESLHRARCFLPRRAAQCLAAHPGLVAPAVAAFYQRDPIDMKACVAMAEFPPETRAMVGVTFTRCLYAQLVQQRFQPGKRFGRRPPSSSPDFKAHDLGAKLACGLEMLATRAVVRAKRAAGGGDGAVAGRDLGSEPRWAAFLAKLVSAGYFRGNIEGSREHARLLAGARASYLAAVPTVAEAQLGYLDASALALHRALQEDLPELAGEATIVEDSEAWMEMTAQELDEVLAARFGVQREGAGEKEGEGGRVASEAERLQEVVAGMKTFMDTASTHEGAELPEDLAALFADEGGGEEEGEEEGGVGFDADSFLTLMGSLLGGVGPEPAEDGGEEEAEDATPPPQPEAATTGAAVGEAMGGGTIAEASAAMERELRTSSKVREGFEMQAQADGDGATGPGAPAGGDGPGIDIDVNLVKNILESYSSQAGLAGPVGNILSSLNLQLPDQAEETNEDDV